LPIGGALCLFEEPAIRLIRKGSLSEAAVPTIENPVIGGTPYDLDEELLAALNLLQQEFFIARFGLR